METTRTKLSLSLSVRFSQVYTHTRIRVILSHTHTHRTDRPINPNLLRRFPLPVPVESIVARCGAARERAGHLTVVASAASTLQHPAQSTPPRACCCCCCCKHIARKRTYICDHVIIYIYIYTRVNNRVNRSPPGLLAEAAIERHFSLIPPATRYRQRAASSTWLVGLAVIRNHDSNILIFNNPLSVFMCVCV